MKRNTGLTLKLLGVLAGVLILSGCRPAPQPVGQLVIFNWEDYLAPETIPAFERRYRAEVVVETFPDERTLLEELQQGERNYDLIVAGNALVEKMIRLGLLQPIDLANISNYPNLDPGFQSLHYDPGNRYSIPYMWGTTGIALNRDKITREADSWSILWNPEYRGRLAMLSDPDEVIGAALKYLGYNINTINHAQLEEARAALVEQKPLLVGYLDPQQIKDGMIAGEIWAAQLYSGDAMMVAEEKPEVVYLIPREGTDLWVDNFAVPAGAVNRRGAELFINFCLEPEISAANANYLRYANTNRAARPLTDPEILADPGLYPPPEVIELLEITSLETFPEIREIRAGIWEELVGE